MTNVFYTSITDCDTLCRRLETASPLDFSVTTFKHPHLTTLFREVIEKKIEWCATHQPLVAKLTRYIFREGMASCQLSEIAKKVYGSRSLTLEQSIAREKPLSFRHLLKQEKEISFTTLLPLIAATKEPEVYLQEILDVLKPQDKAEFFRALFHTPTLLGTEIALKLFLLIPCADFFQHDAFNQVILFQVVLNRHVRALLLIKQYCPLRVIPKLFEEGAFHDAIRTRSKELVQGFCLLTNDNTILFAQDSYGLTPYHRALLTGDDDFIRFIESLFPGLCTTDEKQKAGLFKVASSIGDAKVFESLRQEFKDTFQTLDEFDTLTMLDNAIGSENINILKTVLELTTFGPLVLNEIFGGMNALHRALYNGRIDMAELIYNKCDKIKRKKLIQEKTKDKQTVMHLAAQTGDLTTIRSVIALCSKHKQFDYFARDISRNHPMHYVARYGDSEAARAVYNANLGLTNQPERNDQEQTPLDIAIKTRNFSVAKVLIQECNSLETSIDITTFFDELTEGEQWILLPLMPPSIIKEYMAQHNIGATADNIQPHKEPLYIPLLDGMSFQLVLSVADHQNHFRLLAFGTPEQKKAYLSVNPLIDPELRTLKEAYEGDIERGAFYVLQENTPTLAKYYMRIIDIARSVGYVTVPYDIARKVGIAPGIHKGSKECLDLEDHIELSRKVLEAFNYIRALDMRIAELQMSFLNLEDVPEGPTDPITASPISASRTLCPSGVEINRTTFPKLLRRDDGTVQDPIDRKFYPPNDFKDI